MEIVAWAGGRLKKKVVRHSESLSVRTANSFVQLVFETAVGKDFFPRAVKKITPLLVFVSVFIPFVRRRCSTSLAMFLRASRKLVHPPDVWRRC